MFAEQVARFVPLAAYAVEQAIYVRFLGRERPILVPSAVDTLPVTASQGDLLPHQSGPIKMSLDGGFHHSLKCI